MGEKRLVFCIFLLDVIRNVNQSTFPFCRSGEYRALNVLTSVRRRVSRDLDEMGR